MNTATAEKLFQEILAKTQKPKCKAITDSGTAHDIQLIQREIEGTATDEQIGQWIKDAAADLAAFDAKQIENAMEYFAGVDRWRSANKRNDLLNIGRNEVVLVRRNPPSIARMRKEQGELCWRIAERVGTRVEPYPKRDPRSARAIAIENAKVHEQAQVEQKESDRLAALP